MPTSFEDNTHVFIIRIWLEKRELRGACPTLRGAIEHLVTGERCYLKDLESIPGFIASYIAVPDVPFET